MSSKRNHIVVAMVDTARQLLDELMGRNRNLDPNTAKNKKVQWDDPEVTIHQISLSHCAEY